MTLTIFIRLSSVIFVECDEGNRSVRLDIVRTLPCIAIVYQTLHTPFSRVLSSTAAWSTLPRLWRISAVVRMASIGPDRHELRKKSIHCPSWNRAPLAKHPLYILISVTVTSELLLTGCHLQSFAVKMAVARIFVELGNS